MADEVASWSNKPDSTDTAVPAVNKKWPSRGRTTRAKINVRQLFRLKSSINQYTAVPALSRHYYTNRSCHWAEQLKLLELKKSETITSLIKANKRYSKASLESTFEITKLDEVLCFCLKNTNTWLVFT
jgi:hypothetical protein